MKSRPRGRKYRNLYARKEVIWFEKLVHGRRIRRPAKRTTGTLLRPSVTNTSG